MGVCSSAEFSQSQYSTTTRDHLVASKIIKKKLSTTTETFDKGLFRDTTKQESGDFSSIKQNSQLEESDSSNIFHVNSPKSESEAFTSKNKQRSVAVIPPSPCFGLRVAQKKPTLSPKKQRKKKETRQKEKSFESSIIASRRTGVFLTTNIISNLNKSYEE
jgi:hypothetical protein